jgi:serine/threonine protein kinase
VEADDPLLGQLIDGRYKIKQRLSAGGAGVVYRAQHARLDRPLAIKILSGGMEQDPETVARFEREARVTSRLNHANIVQITDFGLDDTFGLYLVMEFVPGITVRQMVNWNGPLELPSVLEIALQLCAGMADAHSNAIIHRDLKAHNLMVIERDNDTPLVKILDFGIAGLTDGDDGPDRLTRTGMLMGTPAYMAPEQAVGRRPDHLADIYAVGVVMYEMLAGKVPLRGRSPLETLEKVTKERPKPFAEFCGRHDVPAELEQLVFECLAKNPANRPQSFKMVAARLEDILGDASSGEEQLGGTTLSIDLNKIRAALEGGGDIIDILPEPDAFDTSAAGLAKLAEFAQRETDLPTRDRVSNMAEPGDSAEASQAPPSVKPVNVSAPPLVLQPGQKADLTGRGKRKPAPSSGAGIPLPVLLAGAALVGGLLVYVIGSLLFT